MKGGSSGGSSGSSGQNTSTNTTNWQNAWAPGTEGAQLGLGSAASSLENGSLFSPNQYNLANEGYDLASDPNYIDQSSGAYSGLLNPTANYQNNPANQYLTGIASGSNTNPQLDAMFQQGAGQVQQALGGEFNSAGRLGSGAQEFNTSQGLNNLATDIYGGAYAQNQANALSAAGQLSGNYTSGQNTALGAASGLTGDYSSLLSGLNSAYGLSSGVNNASALGDYSSIISPYLNLNNTTQNNSSHDYDDTGSFSQDLGYVGDVASLVGSFA